MNLPFATHRFLIEPLSDEKHIKMVLLERFISFMKKIESSGKSAIRMLKNEAMRDVRSTTGANFRGIMLLLGDMDIKNVSIAAIKSLNYRPICDEDQRKILFAKELNDVINGDTELEGFTPAEVNEMMQFLCVS